MPTTVHQLIEGTEVTTGASPSVTLKFYVDGAASENAALSAVLSLCPDAYNGMPRQSRSAEPISDTKYIVTAKYAPQESNDPDTSGSTPPESSYEFNTGGGSETMFVSLSNKQRVALTDNSLIEQALGAHGIVCIEDLIHVLRESYTIVIVTHSMQQAARVSGRTAFFLMGELVEVDDTQSLFTRPRDKRTEDYITGRFG